MFKNAIQTKAEDAADLLGTKFLRTKSSPSKKERTREKRSGAHRHLAMSEHVRTCCYIQYFL